MDGAARHERIVPAPLIVLLCLGAGALAHHFFPIRFLPGPGVVAPVAGTLLCIGALVIGGSGVREFHRHHTPTNPFKPRTALVTTGVFRYTRNPMYLGFALLALGVAIALDSLAFLLAAVALTALLQVAVIRPEERSLRTSFGAAFDAYASRTRRWI